MIWTLLQTRKSGRYQYLMQTEFAFKEYLLSSSQYGGSIVKYSLLPGAFTIFLDLTPALAALAVRL